MNTTTNTNTNNDEENNFNQCRSCGIETPKVMRRQVYRRDREDNTYPMLCSKCAYIIRSRGNQEIATKPPETPEKFPRENPTKKEILENLR